MKSSLLLTSLAGAGLSSAVDCPAPGFTDSQGRYSCNPAHAYPNGQTCQTIDGCRFLVGADGKPIISTPTTTAAVPTGTPNCPASGFTDSQGRYSCNPAHAYPNGQTCQTIDGCLFLVGADGKPIISIPTTTAAGPTGTPKCPAPGFTDSQGRYSCNPAHAYPNGQTCQTIDGCLFLVGADGKPIISTPTITTGAAQPTGGPVCPPPGSLDKQGRYSCNPAHQYPDGQICTLIDGCYLLCGSDGTPNTTSPSGPVVTAGAATMGGGSMLALVAAAAALL
ncbi:hypothetical protein E4U54_002217 [Claviceps lovelessii]|nr:hypothetical protein E4U54_002217 [Claviceps lovelessii]